MKHTSRYVGSFLFLRVQLIETNISLLLPSLEVKNFYVCILWCFLSEGQDYQAMALEDEI